MNSATATADRSRSSRTCGAPVAAGDATAPRRSCGDQATRASTAGRAQTASAGRQSSSSRVATGTVSPEASAAPSDRLMEYMPMTGPVRCARSVFTTAGTVVLPTAIAAPASTVPAKSARVEWCSRSRTPAARSTSEAPSSRCTPSRPASDGTTNANPPKHSTGIAVSTPAPVEPSPVSAWISDSTGPTEATAGRRLSPMSRRPATSSGVRLTGRPYARRRAGRQRRSVSVSGAASPPRRVPRRRRPSRRPRRSRGCGSRRRRGAPRCGRRRRTS